MQFVKPERLRLRSHPELNEKWVQDRIAEDPSMLGLGDLVLRDRERIQPRAGRLDLLLQDAETDRRYEVEIQLGQTDESHVIRSIEYWDIERKRYPQYEHCAVLIAEDVTSRFLNVISLFNGTIPIIAIQMAAWKFEDKVALMFTTVLDELSRGLVDEDEEVSLATDRAHWESHASRETMAAVDRLLEMIRQFDPHVELKYNKFYIGLAKNGQPHNSVVFRARQNHVLVEPRLPASEEVEKMLGDSGMDVLSYQKRWGRYRVRLPPKELDKHSSVLMDIMKRARDADER